MYICTIDTYYLMVQIIKYDKPLTVAVSAIFSFPGLFGTIFLEEPPVFFLAEQNAYHTCCWQEPTETGDRSCFLAGLRMIRYSSMEDSPKIMLCPLINF